MKNWNTKIFLLDAIGAFISAFALLVLLTNWNTFFGMPNKTLYLLGGIAIGIAIYSCSCYSFGKQNWKNLLRILIVLNAAYVFLSIICMLIHWSRLTNLGIAYFIAEVLIIIGLISLEVRVFFASLK